MLAALTTAHPLLLLLSASAAPQDDEDKPRWLLYHELAFTSKEYMRCCMPVKGAWLIEIAPHFYKVGAPCVLWL